MTKYSTPSEEWLRKKALEEDGCEIGAGMPDHPLRVPEATMTDRVEEIEARHKAVDGDLDISPMDDCELADHEDRAFLLSTIRALQAEVGDSKETEEIAYRDGYEKAVQDIDILTGGDGEFIAVIGADHDGRNCPDPAAMKARIQSRYEALVAKNERLREALKPMADAWHKLQTDGAMHLNADPEKPSHGMGTIKQKHTKRAAELLSGIPLKEQSNG